jgi:hypothetical protein
MLIFPCSRCGESLKFADELAGKSIKCPACDADQVAPAPPSIEPGHEYRFNEKEYFSFIANVVSRGILRVIQSVSGIVFVIEAIKLMARGNDGSPVVFSALFFSGLFAFLGSTIAIRLREIRDRLPRPKA